MKFSSEISQGQDSWLLVFGIHFHRRRNKIWVEATNRQTKERLTMPEDRERITQILSWDMWPQFAVDEFATVQPTLEGFSQ